MLAAYINPEEEDLEVQMHEPYAALIVRCVTQLIFFGCRLCWLKSEIFLVTTMI